MNKLTIRQLLARILMTAAAIILGEDPPRIDISATHLLNPRWPAHARLHEAWLLSTGTLVVCVALYFIWVYRRDRRFGLSLGAVLLGCISGGFFVAAATEKLYGGILTDPLTAPMQPGNGLIFGIAANLVAFSVATVFILIGWALGREGAAPG